MKLRLNACSMCYVLWSAGMHAAASVRRTALLFALQLPGGD